MHLSQNGLISKTAGRRAKWTKIWDSVDTSNTYMGTFDLVGFKVILGSFSALSQNELLSKTAGCRAKWTES